MHTDEAVHAVKTMDMEKTGRFDYDPADYHGPTLHYSIWLRAQLAGKRVADLDAVQLRQVAVFWGLGMIVILALPWPGWRWQTRLAAAALLALSPAAVYYARYLIMEEMFVLFTGGFVLAAWSAWTTGRLPWILLTGFFAGLMHATKETCVLAFGAVAVALLVLAWKRRKATVKQGLVAVAVGVIVSAVLLSGGFRFWSDVAESYTTYLRYLGRGQGAGHEQPFAYYLQLLSVHRDAIRWGEWPILATALLGVVLITLRRDWKTPLGYLALVAGLVAAFYSTIPYKTPWCVLSMHWLLALLGGSAIAFGLEKGRAWWFRLVVMALLLGGFLHFKKQNEWGNGRFAADSRNPWVYGHTSTQISEALDLVADAEQLEPGLQLVVSQREHGWPLPWYLRHMGGRARFNDAPPESLEGAGIVISDSAHYDTLDAALPGFVRSTFGLRPDVVLTVFTEPALHERILALRAQRREATDE